MKKRIIVTCILCLVAVFALAACSTGTDTPSASPSAEATTEATPTPTPTPTPEATTEATPEVSAENSPSPEAVTLDGAWTDPLTGNVLTMKADGTFTLTKEDGTAISDGTYVAAAEGNTYDVTYADGTMGSFLVNDLVIEFTNADGVVVTYEAEGVTPADAE